MESKSPLLIHIPGLCASQQQMITSILGAERHQRRNEMSASQCFPE